METLIKGTKEKKLVLVYEFLCNIRFGEEVTSLVTMTQIERDDYTRS